MDAGLALFVLWIGGLVGFFGSVQFYRMTVLSWAERQWRLTREPIHFGPVGATCYGTEPGANYRRREGHYGAVGIVDEQLVFSTRQYERFLVPLASITWIGERRITVSRGKGTKEVTALMVHGEYQGDWFVIALSSNEYYAIEQQLSAHCKLRVEELGDRRESRGPAMATRVTQNIYGEWHEDSHGTLFLAPDRLLFARFMHWNSGILLSDIREIGAFSKGGVLNSLNPFAEDLLRIECQPTPDGKPEVIGFLVRDADDWAEAIRSRSPVPVAVHAGRKKKTG